MTSPKVFSKPCKSISHRIELWFELHRRFPEFAAEDLSTITLYCTKDSFALSSSTTSGWLLLLVVSTSPSRWYGDQPADILWHFNGKTQCPLQTNQGNNDWCIWGWEVSDCRHMEKKYLPWWIYGLQELTDNRLNVETNESPLAWFPTQWQKEGYAYNWRIRSCSTSYQQMYFRGACSISLRCIPWKHHLNLRFQNQHNNLQAGLRMNSFCCSQHISQAREVS